MKRSFRNLVSTALALGLVGGAGLAMAGPATAAPTCQSAQTTNQSNHVAIYMPYLNGSPVCNKVQAKMDRYVGGSQPIITRTGPISGSTSEVKETVGSNAGNKVRHQTGSSWSAWRNA